MDVTRLDLDVLTPKQLDALRIALEPRQSRGTIDSALGLSRQARSNRLRRARKALLAAETARLGLA